MCVNLQPNCDKLIVNSMKRYIHTLCIMLSSVLLFSSCLKSDDDTITDYYNDTAITAFQLASINRYVHTTTSAGKDTVYKVTKTNPAVFTIDQYRRKIYNTDSLLADYDLNHVLATISSKNGGTVVIKSLSDSTLTLYSSTDSIDFTMPREIRVYAQDGSTYRAYEVTVNIHQVATGKMLWEKMSTPAPETTDTARWAGLVAEAGLQQFIGAGRAEAYAFSNEGELMVSMDEGLTWSRDSLDDDSTLLPTDNFAFVSYPFVANDSTDYQLMIGTNDQSPAACVVWRKIAEFAKGSSPSKWVLIPVESYNQYALPRMDNLNLLYYQDKVLAIGNDGNIYISRDQGITWKTTTTYTLPDDIGTYNVNATTDDDGYIWLVGKDTGEVWRGIMIE